MPSTPKPKPNPPDSWKSLLAFGTEIAGILLGWLALGYLADRYAGTRPFGMLVGGLLAVGHVLWRIVRL